jgi:hypothetical protein
MLERAMGIEPTALAWEARVLPLYDARAGRYFTGVSALWGIGIVVGGVKSVCTWKVIAGIEVEFMRAIRLACRKGRDGLVH